MGYNDLNKNQRTDWVTPPDCQELLAQFAPLALDVCTTAQNPMGAQQIYTPATNGLEQSWQCGGLVWCNHPWSRTESPKWVRKAVREGEEARRIANVCLSCGLDYREAHTHIYAGEAICESSRNSVFTSRVTEVVLLGPSRPDTGWFRQIWSSANAIYFWKGRMTFYHPVSGLPCMGFNKKTKRWEEQPVPVPVQVSYWGPRVEEFIRVFSQQGGVHRER